MNRVKGLREKKGWRQVDLAERINVKQQTVAHYEKGDRDIDSATICRLCDLFGCTADYLLGRSDLPAFDLTPEEISLIRAWRSCDADTKSGLMLILKPFWKEASDGKAI